MQPKRLVRMFATSALSAACAATVLPARADCPAFSNFENGIPVGWLTSTTGGSGSTGTEQHNTSSTAVVKHTGTFSHALSCDANYVADTTLSFVMHAIATASGTGLGGTLHAASGVKISFLNAVNVALGSIGLYNVTTSAWLGTRDFAVDTLQHDYSGTMASFASAAGLAANAAIAKVSLSFVSTGESYTPTGTNSLATVWFDNVAIGAVPEPSQQALLLAGLAATALLVRRRRSRGR